MPDFVEGAVRVMSGFVRLGCSQYRRYSSWVRVDLDAVMFVILD